MSVLCVLCLFGYAVCGIFGVLPFIGYYAHKWKIIRYKAKKQWKKE